MREGDYDRARESVTTITVLTINDASPAFGPGRQEVNVWDNIDREYFTKFREISSSDTVFYGFCGGVDQSGTSRRAKLMGVWKFLMCACILATICEGVVSKETPVRLRKRGAHGWVNYMRENPVRGKILPLNERLGKTCRLLVHKVDDQTNKDYLPCVREFLNTCVRCRLPLSTIKEIDLALATELDMMCYGEQLPVYKGTRLCNGRVHAFPSLKKKLPCSGRALASWQELTETKQGQPVWEGGVLLIAGDMISRGKLLEALVVLLSYDAYLREQDWEGLRGEDIKTSRQKGELRVALELGPRKHGEKRKTGSDQGVEIEDEWVKGVLEKLDSGEVDPEDPVFPFDQAHFRREWGKSEERLKITNLVGPAHSLRHSRPSQQAKGGSRSLEQIRRRGRWKHLKSVERYSKEHAITAQLPLLPSLVREHGERALDAPFTFLQECVKNTSMCESDLGHVYFEVLEPLARRDAE